VFGAGYRFYDGDDLGDGPGFYFDPRERSSHRLTAFAQDEITMTRSLFLTVGSKFEGNEFTGVEVQPTLRLRSNRRQAQRLGRDLEGRACATRFDTDLRFRVPGTDTLFLTGSDTFKSENVLAYEAGYRQTVPRAPVDRPRGLFESLRRPSHPGSRAGNAHHACQQHECAIAGHRGNRGGANFAAVQVHYSHSYLWKELTFDAGSNDPTRGTSEANDPTHFFKIRSYAS
jgi:iron complex outermembrane receptor protein